MQKGKLLYYLKKYNTNNATTYVKKENLLFNSIGKKAKDRGFLKKDEFLEIVKWKSNRAISKAERNPADMIEKLTRFSFSIDDERYKIKILTCLEGVYFPIASSILTVIFPKRYGIIDVRAWASLYRLGLIKKQKTNFSISDWLEYLTIIRTLAKSNNLTPREVDKALFSYDKEVRKGNLYAKR